MRFFLILLSSFLIFPAFAAETLSYSGRLANSDGSPVSGPVNLRFQMVYTNDTSTVLCQTDVSSVPLSNGVFHVKLEVIPADCSGDSLTKVLLEIPTGQALAIRVIDQSHSVTYDYQAIHAAPYSLMSEMAKTLAPPPATATPGQVLKWNGTAWAAANDEGGGTTATVSAVTNSGGNITLSPNITSGSVVVTATTVSATYTSGAVVVSGGVGVAGNINSDGAISSNASVAAPVINAGTSIVSPQIYGSTAAGGDIRIDGTSNATKGDVFLSSAGGNVGVGTTTPQAKLDVTVSSAASANLLKLTNSSNSSALVIGSVGSADNYIAGAAPGDTAVRADTGNLSLGVSAGGAINFGSSIEQWMRITSTGNVGIGTSTPGAKLSVRDGTTAEIQLGAGPAINSANSSLLKFTGAPDASGGFTSKILSARDTGSDYNSYLAFFTESKTAVNFTDTSAERMRIDKDGKVGIGTSSPTAVLHLKAGTAAANTAPIKLTAGTNLTTPEVGAIEFDGTNLYITDNTPARRTILTGAGGYSTGSTIESNAGTASAPGLSFSTDTDSGFYSAGANQVGVSVGGSQIYSFSANGLSSPTTGGAAITTAAGTASAPTYSFSGDPDTGWFRPFADTLAAATGGIERVRIDPSGNVGIGTTNPAVPLHVVGVVAVENFGTNNYMQFGRSNGTSVARTALSNGDQISNIAFSGHDGSNYLVNSTFESFVDGPVATGSVPMGLKFTTGTSGSAERMRISSNGNIGISSTNPLHKLTVDGGNAFITNPATSSYVYLGRDNTGAPGTYGYLSWVNTDDTLRLGAGADHLTITESGTVGIASTNPTGKLQVAGGVQGLFYTTSDYLTGVMGSGLQLITGTDTGNTYSQLQSYASGGVAYGDVAINPLGGFVGIGTNSPTDLLHLKTTSNDVGITIEGASAGISPTLKFSDASGMIHARIGIAGSDNNMSSGSLENDLVIRTEISGQNIHLAPNATTAMTLLNANGNVGIGTTFPSAALHLKAGTATANTAPLKLTAGTNLTTPEVGAIEFDGTNLFITDNTSARRTILTSSGGYTSGSTIESGAGSAAAPGLSFSTDTDTGFFSAGANQVGVSAGGSQIFSFDANGLSSTTVGGAAITTSAGSAAAPTFSFAGDSDTGWFRPLADTLAAATGGTERVRIDATGNVGIGTNNPTTILDVRLPDNGSQNGIIFNGQRSVAGGHAVRMEMRAPNSPAAANNKDFQIINSNGAAGLENLLMIMPVTDAGVNKSGISLTHSGNVGIGTTTPANKLQVNGVASVRVDSTAVAPESFFIQGLTDGNQQLYFGYNTSSDYGSIQALKQGEGSKPLMLNPLGGNVGIGTTTPSATLDVYGSTGTASVNVGTNGTLSSGGALFTVQSNTYPMILRSPDYVSVEAGGFERARYLANGNVGIGTSIPQRSLHVVEHTVTNRPTARFDYSNGSGGIEILGASPSSAYIDFGESTGVTSRGRIEYQNSTSTLGADSMAFTTNGTEKMRINANGNIGIGTSAPGSKLEVVGDAVFSPSNPAHGVLALRTGGFDYTGYVEWYNPGGSRVGYLGYKDGGPNNLGLNLENSANFIINGGSVGIGTTSPTIGKIQISQSTDTSNSGIAVVNSAGTTGMRIWTDSSGNGSIDVSATGTNPLILNRGGGDVGIGTISPSEKLEVNGNVKAVSFISTSDRRLKENLRSVPGLKTIDAIKGYRFDWKETGKTEYGVMAQDVEKVMPEAVVTNEETGYKGVNYNSLFAPVIEAIKELKAKVFGHDKRIDELYKEIKALKSIESELRKRESDLKKRETALEERILRLENLHLKKQ